MMMIPPCHHESYSHASGETWNSFFSITKTTQILRLQQKRQAINAQKRFPTIIIMTAGIKKTYNILNNHDFHGKIDAGQEEQQVILDLLIPLVNNRIDECRRNNYSHTRWAAGWSWSFFSSSFTPWHVAISCNHQSYSSSIKPANFRNS